MKYTIIIYIIIIIYFILDIHKGQSFQQAFITNNKMCIKFTAVRFDSSQETSFYTNPASIVNMNSPAEMSGCGKHFIVHYVTWICPQVKSAGCHQHVYNIVMVPFLIMQIYLITVVAIIMFILNLL